MKLVRGANVQTPSLRDACYLRVVARLALRGHGGAEPNPMVGCVIVDGLSGTIVGWGYHRRCGQEHAEVAALRRAGQRAQGATAYVTLEPCNHTGRTGPCTTALIKAGIQRVVFACHDPNPRASGGAAALRAAGVTTELNDSCDAAVRISHPFVHRVTTGLPWIVAKWAQTLDGRIATRTGESQWISSPASRTLVHRERGRVDAILTGVGTVLHDNPLLTARDVRVRRIARRIIVDPHLRTPVESAIVQTCAHAPTTIITAEDAPSMHPAAFNRLRSAGVQIITTSNAGSSLCIAPALRSLAAEHDITNVLVDGGPRLLGRLFTEKLVNEAWVFVAPLLLGDDEAPSCVRGLTAEQLTDGVSLTLRHVRRRAGDIILRYSVDPPSPKSAGVSLRSNPS